MWWWIFCPLQSRHNGRDGVSNHQPHDCLLNCLFRRRSKKTSRLRVTGLFEGNSPVTGEFPAQMASNAENVSIWWRHHVLTCYGCVEANVFEKDPGRDCLNFNMFQHLVNMISQFQKAFFTKYIFDRIYILYALGQTNMCWFPKSVLKNRSCLWKDCLITWDPPHSVKM